MNPVIWPKMIKKDNREYRIAWKSKITDKTGKGDWMTGTQFTAVALCEHKNREYKDIVHWVESRIIGE